jgi:hypothetical protein
LVAVTIGALPVPTGGQSTATPSARLVPAPRLAFAESVDSNTPVLWSLADGLWQMSAITSWGGLPLLSTGSALEHLTPPQAVQVINHPGHGTWFESMVEDDAGTWYSYYHHELPADHCGRPEREIPRIGSMRSFDRGRTWEDLGVVLEAPPDSVACDSSNPYMLGGVGDLSAVLDHDKQDLFIYFSQYARDVRAQGVAVARLAWADRDTPTGRAAVWNGGAWIPARAAFGADGVTPKWEYPLGAVLVPATRSWHDGVAGADAYWGPSLHWNTYLEQWVMLVNRTRNEKFDLDGHYVAFTPTMSDPASWSRPVEVLNAGGWYSQVVGLEPQDGTDKRAGRRARFFVTGRSDHFIEFSK